MKQKLILLMTLSLLVVNNICAMQESTNPSASDSEEEEGVPGIPLNHNQNIDNSKIISYLERRPDRTEYRLKKTAKLLDQRKQAVKDDVNKKKRKYKCCSAISCLLACGYIFVTPACFALNNYLHRLDSKR